MFRTPPVGVIAGLTFADRLSRSLSVQQSLDVVDVPALSCCREHGERRLLFGVGGNYQEDESPLRADHVHGVGVQRMEASHSDHRVGDSDFCAE